MKVLNFLLAALLEAQKVDKGPTRGPRGRGRKLQELQALYQSQLKQNESRILERASELEEDSELSRALSFSFLEQFSKVAFLQFFFCSYSFSTKLGENQPETRTTICSFRSMTTAIWSSNNSTITWQLLKIPPTTSYQTTISFWSTAAIATCSIKR